MAENSKIEWTDHTFNPWIGCTKVSDGCKNCYAEARMDKRFKKVEWGPTGARRRTSDTNWKKPLAWNRKAEKEGERHRVFCASLADIFEFHSGQFLEIQKWRMELYNLIDATPQLDWLLLTKRPENVTDMLPLPWQAIHDGFPPNVWIGTSVENQKQADIRIPELLRIPAKVRFLSMEPLLGPIDLTNLPSFYDGAKRPLLRLDALRGSHWCGHDRYGPSHELDSPPCIHWVIVGGESGTNARPMHPAWARSIRDQCEAADVPFLFKQWGEWIPSSHITPSMPSAHVAWPWADREMRNLQGDTTMMFSVGKKATGRLLDGQTWNQFPQAED